MSRRRERRILAATAAVAVGVPIGAAAWIRARTDALAERLGAVGGVPARIGRIDASLTGAIRLVDVGFDELVSADAIEASVALGSLLDGRLRADEIRVEAPRVAIAVDASGDSDLARLARRLARARPGRAPDRPSSVRRIIVAEGTLTARLAGIGELSAADVELAPTAAGVRVVTGRVELRGRTRGVEVDLTFARGAADLSLSTMQFGRVLAVGGAGTVAAGPGSVAVRDVAAARLAPAGPLELRAAIDDGGIPRTLAAEIAYHHASPQPPELAITLRGDRIPLRALATLAPRGVDVRSTRASGSLTIRSRTPVDPAAPRLEVSGAGRVEGLVIGHPAFAAEPVPVTAAIEAEVAISPDTIAVGHAGFELGAARLSTSGWIRRGSPSSGQLEVELATAPCGELFGSLPAELRGPLDGLALTGSVGARARLAVDLAAPAGDGVTLTSAVQGGCEVVAEPPLADVTTLAEPGIQQLADGTRARIGRGVPGHVELRELPSFVAGAFVSAEDARFYDHGGFDLLQIARSLEIDLREHRLARGGSTISQQLVKNAFLSQRRTVDRKLQEAILTWRLEARVDKRHILERYLDIIELGPRVFGLGAAARYWFDCSPRHLTLRQAAFLAALTSEPASMSRRVRRAGALDPESAERVAVVLYAMLRDRVIGAEAYEAAKISPLRFAATALAD